MEDYLTDECREMIAALCGREAAGAVFTNERREHGIAAEQEPPGAGVIGRCHDCESYNQPFMAPLWLDPRQDQPRVSEVRTVRLCVLPVQYSGDVMHY